MKIWNELGFTDDFKTCLRPTKKFNKDCVYFHDNTIIIKDKAFENKDVKEVFFNDCVEKIGEKAFKNCDLKRVILEQDVLTLGWECFYGNKNIDLCSINIKEVPEDCFRESNINRLNLKNTTFIASGAFESCTLNKITLPDTIRVIGYSVFQETNFSEDFLILPPNVKSIFKDAFYKSSLKYIYLPDAVEFVDERICGNDVTICTSEKVIKNNPILSEKYNVKIMNKLDILIENGKSFKDINKKFKEEER